MKMIDWNGFGIRRTCPNVVIHQDHRKSLGSLVLFSCLALMLQIFFFYSTGTKWLLHNLFFFIKIVFLLSCLKIRNLFLKTSNLSLSSHHRNNFQLKFLWIGKRHAQRNYIYFLKRLYIGLLKARGIFGSATSSDWFG